MSQKFLGCPRVGFQLDLADRISQEKPAALRLNDLWVLADQRGIPCAGSLRLPL